jgi:hypothetical protein
MLDRIKDFFKKFWGFFVAILGVGAGLLLVKKKVEYYDDFVQKLQQSHQKEVDEIKAAREEERKKYEENERKFKERMEIIEKEYETAKKELDEKKRTELINIVRKYGNKPDKLAERLAQVTGFKIILPE